MEHIPSHSAYGKVSFKYAASHEWIKIRQTVSIDTIAFSSFKDEFFNLLINEHPMNYVSQTMIMNVAIILL